MLALWLNSFRISFKDMLLYISGGLLSIISSALSFWPKSSSVILRPTSPDLVTASLAKGGPMIWEIKVVAVITIIKVLPTSPGKYWAANIESPIATPA